jgi:hypothetical protein
MLPQISDIKKYTFSEQDHLLLDANIWMSIYGPIAKKDWRTSVYSAALKEIRKNNCEIFIDVLILSEFINAFSRIEFKQLNPINKPKEFKDFRNSSQFKPYAQEISINARKIIKICRRCDSVFEYMDLPSLLAQYEGGESDFNDQILVEICKSKDLTLITHNADFKAEDINILTANKNLLKMP